MLVDPIHDMPEKAQETGMVDARKPGHLGVISIHSKEVLVQVVSSDAEEIQFGTELVENKGDRRHLNHDSQRDAPIE